MSYLVRRLTTDKHFIDYEKGLYTTYIEQNGIEPVNWEVEGDRLIPNISREDQIVYGLFDGDRLLACIGVNANIDEHCEFRDNGFPEYVPEEKKWLDGVGFFGSPAIKEENLDFFGIYTQLFNETKAALSEQGWEAFYITCEEKMLKIYGFMGFELVEQRDAVEHRYLMRFSL